MVVNEELIEDINQKKIYHRFLELDLSKEALQELLKKSLVTHTIQLFRTRRARDLLTQLTKKIKSYATTPYGKLLVHTLLPTQNIQEIKKRQKQCVLATKIKIPTNQFKELILRTISLTYTSSKKHNGTCIAFSDEEQYTNLRSILSKKFYVTLIESEQDLVSIDHYEHIRFIKQSNSYLSRSAETMAQVTVVDSYDLLDIAPEFITDIIEEHKDALEAIRELQSHIYLSFQLPLSSIEIKRKSFQVIQSLMQEEFNQFQSFLSLAISKANFSGQQLLNIVNQKQSILDYLTPQSSKEIQETKNILQQKLEELTSLSCVELFSITSLGELSIDEKKLLDLEKEYLGNQEELLYTKKIVLAHQWETTISILPELIEEIYQYDLLIALRDFILTYELSPPQIVLSGISFVYGRNMNIPNATPIEYHITEDDQVAIITGANSGGKTTLLELLGQIQILTHMGLYVPAKNAQVGLVNEIYYFSKNKGSLSAGAFETLLKQFSGISDDDSKKLILADEIESVTEPDVAAKIIKGIIRHLRRSKHNILVLVTHMGRELEKLEVQGRFDGIEAKGLDKELNLVVDRNPVIGRIARSTPQLIIERLAKINKTPFYEGLKELIT